MSQPGSYYLTTPIYYVNARPHIGHAYTTLVSDAMVRYQRAQLGRENVWFLTGTDEHGQKIERSASAAGKSPLEFADEVSAEFRTLWDSMGLTYNDYIRTTEERHKRGVQKLFRTLRERGYIYKGTYSGQYCVFDELYVEGTPGTPCPDCGRVTETVAEENYFFKLSAFERRLLDLIYEPARDGETPREGQLVIEPDTRRNEVLSFIRSGLRDLSISRTSFRWGIPVPDDEKHVIYVWMDALSNYITAVGYGSDEPKDKAMFAKYWPAEVQVMGKEITRFHCVYWPAFLLAAGIAPPKKIVAHGWLLFEESKMSKSRGNIVRAETIVEVLGTDALRYFLMREVVFGQDGSFSFDALVERYNADLANGYGNLVSRTLSMIAKYFDGVVPESAGESSISALVPGVVQKASDEFAQFHFTDSLREVWQLVSALDGYITAQAPWKIATEGTEESRLRLAGVLYTAAEAIRVITALVYPVIPDAAAKVWLQLGLGSLEEAADRGELKQPAWGGLRAGTKLGELGPVFPRAETKSKPATATTPAQKGAVERMQEIEDNNRAATPAPANQISFSQADGVADNGTAAAEKLSTAGSAKPVTERAASENASVAQPVAPATATHGAAPTPEALNAATPAPAAAPVSDKITIDDFAKVELRVAQIKVAERVPKADKLLRLEVDLGYEQRQILAGIAEAYTPESLIGRKVVIVANLAPRKLRGFESNGMIVAASLGEKGTPVLAGFLEDVEIGARLK